MSKYTPGPWKVFNAWQNGDAVNFSRIGNESKTIITVQNSDDVTAFNEADLHLIAAAPELLETLDYLRKELRAAQAYICQPKEIETWLDDMEERARVVIAKAKGES